MASARFGVTQLCRFSTQLEWHGVGSLPWPATTASTTTSTGRFSVLGMAFGLIITVSVTLARGGWVGG